MWELALRECVYFIAQENGPIKIGKAVNVKQRLRDLQCANGYKLTLMGVILGEEGLETSLHKKFKHLNTGGEWFRRCDELIDYIQNHSTELTDLISSQAMYSHQAKRHQKVVWHREFEKKSLMANNIELFHEVSKDIEDGISKALLDEVVEHSVFTAIDTINAARDFDQLIRYISNGLAKRGLTYIFINDLRKQVRRIVDKTLGTNWRDSETYLYSDEINYDELEQELRRYYLSRIRGYGVCKSKLLVNKLEESLNEVSEETGS